MPSYPIRPTFPIDVRSPSGTVRVGRQGASVMIDADLTGGGGLPPTPFQFFAALDAAYPGASAAVQAAVPSDPSDPINRAYRGTALVVAGSSLAQFVKATLALSDQAIAAVLAAAAIQPK